MTALDRIGYGRPDALFDLLPLVVRQRDAGRGFPLRALLRVLGEQVGEVEEAIATLGDEPFVETCSDAAVPLLGELVGWTPVADAGLAALALPGRDLLRDAVLVPRRDVANTVRHRRRKGTLALLTELARDVAGWPARAVERGRWLAGPPHVAHLRPGRGRSVDVREMDALEQQVEPARTVDVRGAGPNLPTVTVSVWRLRCYPMTGAPAAQAEHVDGPHVFTFDTLYRDVPLFVRADRPGDLPRPLTRRMLEDRAGPGAPGRPAASPEFYGRDRSLSITAHDWPKQGVDTEIPATAVRPADLSDWRRYRVEQDTVAVDPERGRILFRPGQAPSAVTVDYLYGFPADLGGGEYDRVVPRGPGGAGDTYTGWAADGDELAGRLAEWRAAGVRYGVIELTRTVVYDARVSLELVDGQQLVIRAAARTRPIVWLPDRRPDRADSLAATLQPGCRLVLDGLTLAGRAVRLTGLRADPAPGAPESGDVGDPCPPTRVTIRHCTLVPGRVPAPERDTEQPPPPALELADLGGALVDITHSVVGPVMVGAPPHTAPLLLRVTDSIVDALLSRYEAIGTPGEGVPPVTLTLARATVRGSVRAHAVDLVENAIVLGELAVARRRTGCVRFSWVEPGSCTPRRFHCQPETAVAALGMGAPAAAAARERARVHPRFTATASGAPAYFQLARGVAEEIRRGADDTGEIGVYHDLHQPQRQANLVARLLEYTPAGLQPVLVLAT